jgi:hypothetical protein
METPYDIVLAKLAVDDKLRTPDASAGKPFSIMEIDSEAITVRTSRGGRVRISPFTFDTAVKYLGDLGIAGDVWLEVKDDVFQAVLNSENDRVRAASYVLAILAHAGLIDVDGRRPNKVRMAST